MFDAKYLYIAVNIKDSCRIASGKSIFLFSLFHVHGVPIILIRITVPIHIHV